MKVPYRLVRQCSCLALQTLHMYLVQGVDVHGQGFQDNLMVQPHHQVVDPLPPPYTPAILEGTVGARTMDISGATD